MATEVVNSFNIFVDSERWLTSSSNGNSIDLPLSQTPISCASNQYIRLTLQSFSMYKSWTNVNANNKTYRLTCADVFPAGTNAPLSAQAISLNEQNYENYYELALDFANSLATELTAYTGVVATPLLTSIAPDNNVSLEGTSNNVISFEIDMASPVAWTNPVILQMFVADGDIFELLGGNRIRDPANLATPSIQVVAVGGSTKVNVQCYYNAQLSTQQNVYLRTDTGSSNIQTTSFNAGNTDQQGQSNLSSSSILAKIPIDNEFANFTTGSQMEYFLSLSTKNLTFMRLYITDSHNRPIPQYTNIANTGTQQGGTEQDTLGNRSFECVVKVDIVQYLSQGNNVLQTTPPVKSVPARFGTEPLNKYDYGASNFPTPTFGLDNMNL